MEFGLQCAVWIRLALVKAGGYLFQKETLKLFPKIVGSISPTEEL
jgi:hypothetical protein